MGKTFRHTRDDAHDLTRNKKKKTDKFAQRQQRRLRTITAKQKTVLPTNELDNGGIDRL